MSKDKIIGLGLALIFLLGLILYTLAVPIPLLLTVLGEGSWNPGLLADFGLPFDMNTTLFWLMVPVFGGVFLFSFIVIWIGWTMATTPPPEPIDLDSLDLDDDDEDEDKED
ncbi:MAG: hypothetical protein ACW981_08060 [Candidatus Hodarchaeales archaeon]|jgi:hypothetical protein